MASQNTILHKRQSLGKQTVYNYRFDCREGMDSRLLNRQGNGHRAALLDNLYRNKKKGVDGIESFPGYSRILTAFDGAGKLNGAYSHDFDGCQYLFLHIGASLYIIAEKKAARAAAPTFLANVNDAPSVGVSFGRSFYLWDQKDVIEIASPDSLTVLGDEAYTDEMEDYGRLPETHAYIPLVLKNGEKYEDKNFLTAYYDIEDLTAKNRRVYDDYGLKLRKVWYHDGEALEVFGLEAGRNALFVPNEAEYLGEILPIVSIASEAFLNAKIKVAVIGEKVERISEGDGRGAFGGCELLEKVALFGAATIGSNAFSGCTALREVILPKSLVSIDQSAFSDCTALERVYYEGEDAPSFYAFGETVTVFTNTYLSRVKVGEEIRVAIDPDKYSRVYSVSEASAAAIGSFKRYGGWSTGVFGDDQGYVTQAKSAIALCGICFDCHLESENDRYAFLTVEGDGPLFTEFEEPTAIYRIPIPRDCRALDSVTLDGEAASYTSIFKKEGDTSYLSSLRFVFPCAAEKKVAVRIFSDGKDIGALLRDFPDFGATRDTIVKAARALGVKREKLYLSGIAALPGAVLVSESPRRENTGLYFPIGAAAVISRHRIHALHACKERVAYLADGEVGYLEKGKIASGVPAYRAISYRDGQYFLLKDGVYRLDEGVSVSYTHLDKLSEAIAEGVFDFQSAKLAAWQGYLVLLFGDRAYLADLDSLYRENGKDLPAWYQLSSLGDKNGAPFTALLCVADRLYFFTEDGSAYLVSEDAEGYDGRAVESTLISEVYDMDCEYLYKKPSRKSLVFSGYATPDAITVSLAGAGDTFKALGEVRFTKEEGVYETVPIAEERQIFLRERIKLSGKKIAPLSVAFRYRVLKRRVK